MAGKTTQNITSQPVIDTLIGNRDGSTALISTDALATQLISAGPVSDQMDVLESQITASTIAVSSWAELLSRTAPTVDGTGAEVLDVDIGQHQKATASGYDGTLEANAGRYSWNAEWARWERIGATGLSQTATQAQLNAVRDQLLEEIQAVTGGLNVQAAWSATAPFPTAAERGDYYIVSSAGTVDGVSFTPGDWLVAITDTPSTTTFAGNWLRAPYGAPSVTSYDTMTEFVAADLSALPDGRTIQVEGYAWIKVAGQTEFAKQGWEPVQFDTVADLKLSRRTMATGTEVSAQDYKYEVEPAVFAEPHILTAGGVRLSVKGNSVDVDAFGADPSGVRECSAEWNICVQWCASRGVHGRSRGDYYLDHTVTPGGTLRWDFGAQTLLQYKAVDTANLTEIQACPAGETEYVGSGMYVLFDTSGCQDSTLDGQLVIAGSQVGSMPLAIRKNIRSNVVGIAAATSHSPEMLWDKLHIRGCAVGLYQPPFQGSKAAILGFTRWTIHDLQLSLNLSPFESGADGNGFDEFNVSNLRVTRCGGRNAVLRGTEMAGGFAFLNGLDDVNDREPGTVALTAASNIATLSVANPDLTVGMKIGIKGGTSSLSGNPLWFVAHVTNISGTQITLDRNAENTVAAGDYVAAPFDLELFAAGWNFQRTYQEEILGYGMLVRNQSWVLGSFKSSKGVLGCMESCPVVARPDPGTSCTIDILAEGTNMDHNLMKGLVAVAPLRENAVYNSISCKVKVVGRRSNYGVNSTAIRVIETVGAPVAANDMYSTHDEHHEDLTLFTEYDHFSVYSQQIAGSVDAWTTGKHGAETPTLVHTLSDGTAQGGFSSTSGGSSIKTAPSNGYIAFDVDEDTRYRISIEMPSGTVMAPDLRWYNGGTFLFVDRVVCRAPGLYVVHCTSPATATRLRFYGNETSEFTVTKLTIEQF